MHRVLVVLSLLVCAPTFAQSPPLALESVRVHEAYIDHPLVLAVRSQGYLAILDREKVLDKRFPTDRAWAVLDAVGGEGVGRHAVDAFMAQGLLARLAIGPSGALKAHDIAVARLDARQAFALGWLRALAANGDSKKLLRRSTKVSDAGALELLEHAEKLAPTVQAIRLAHELVATVADPDARNACGHAVRLAKLARDGGAESVRLAAAERVDALARYLGTACAGREMADVAASIQLPPPPPELAPGQRAPSKQSTAAPPPASTPFVVTAPVFRGWLTDPLVAKVAGGARVDAAILQEALQRDATGDLAIVVLNATALTGRQTADQTADVAWQAVAARHGVTGDPTAVPIALATLTPAEATVYGYAQALKPQGIAQKEDLGNARPLSPATLFAAAKGKLPSAATLGPLMALGHNIDLEREPNHCRPIDLEDALRGVVLRANLPEAARQPLVQALDTLLGQCKVTTPQRVKP